MHFSRIDFVEFLKEARNYLDYGTAGLGLVLAILSVILIVREQRINRNRRHRALFIYIFIGFAIIVMSLGLTENIISSSGDKGNRDQRLPDPIEIKEEDGGWHQDAKSEFQTLDLFDDPKLWNQLSLEASSITELLIVGAHLQNGVGRIKPVIETVLNNGGMVKVVVTDPFDSTSIAYQQQRKDPPSKNGLIQGLVVTTLNDLNDLRKETQSGTLVVGLINRPLDERIHIVKNGVSSDKAYIKLYPYKHKHQLGVEFGGLYFKIQKGKSNQDYTYEYYQQKFNNYLENSKKIKLKEYLENHTRK